MLKLSYVRQTTRESYEEFLVQTLVALGYEITLSDDLDDEILGIDAWITDPKTQRRIPLDFFAGCARSQNLPAKLAKATVRGILVLHIPETLCASKTSSETQALDQIKAITHKTLRQARFMKVMTEEVAQRERLAALKELYYKNSKRVIAA